MEGVHNYLRNWLSDKKLNIALIAFGTFVALFHIINVFFTIESGVRFYTTHLGLTLLLVILASLRESKRKVRRYIAVFTLVLALITLSYFWINSDRLEGVYGFISDTDFILGILILIPPFLATWLCWGPIVPLIALPFIAYFFWGHLIPGPLFHVYFTPKYVISYLSTGLGDGMFGTLLPASANMIFFFMLLGGILGSLGVVPSFMEIGKWIGRIFKGGAAYISWSVSALVASIEGAGSANVVITGSFTIPAMKEGGFRPKDAAAIEAVAAQGGQITPPVMGSTVFIMASFLGVTYAALMVQAIMGALAYYIILFIGITIFCYANNMKRLTGVKVDVRTILRRFPIFLIPLVVVVVMLLQKYSITRSCTVSILCALVMALILAPETRSIAKLGEGFYKGALAGAQIAIFLALVGMMSTAIISTGLGPKVSIAVMSLTGGAFFPSLVIIAGVCLVLGMGVPVPVAYILVAILMLPTLVTLGSNLFASHFFAFYFAVWAGLTPPVAVTAMIASRIANSGFFATCWSAVRLMLPILIMPFTIIYWPDLLNFPTIGTEALVAFFLMLLDAGILSTALHGWLFTKLSTVGRITNLLAGIGIFAYLCRQGIPYLIAGLCLLAIVVIWQVRLVRLGEKQVAVPA